MIVIMIMMMMMMIIISSSAAQCWSQPPDGLPIGILSLIFIRVGDTSPTPNPQPAGPWTLLLGLPHLSRGDPVLMRQLAVMLLSLG